MNEVVLILHLAAPHLTLASHFLLQPPISWGFYLFSSSTVGSPSTANTLPSLAFVPSTHFSPPIPPLWYALTKSCVFNPQLPLDRSIYSLSPFSPSLSQKACLSILCLHPFTFLPSP